MGNKRKQAMVKSCGSQGGSRGGCQRTRGQFKTPADIVAGYIDAIDRSTVQHADWILDSASPLANTPEGFCMKLMRPSCCLFWARHGAAQKTKARLIQRARPTVLERAS